MAIEHARPFPSNPSEDANFGKAMEFPESAIEAYGRYRESRKEGFLIDFEEPQLTEEEKAFSFFRLSSQNWEKEIEWLEQIIVGVKEYSPRIYEQVMEEHKKMIAKRP
jgi:hypothetical protein